MPSNNLSGPRPATRLKYPLYEANGLLLLAAGSEITPRLRSLLSRRGIRLDFACKLEVIEGPQVGLVIPVKQATSSIGRKPECQIRPDSEFVSGVHCHIHKRAFGVFVTDAGSTNGTFLNQEAVGEETELADGDMLRVGPIVFRVELYAEVAAAEEEDQQALQEWLLAEPMAAGEVGGRLDGKTVQVPNLSHFFRDGVGSGMAASKAGE